MKTFELRPAVISISVPGGSPVEIDPYTALEEIRRLQDTETRWDDLCMWLAEKLDVDPDELKQNQLYEFNDLVIEVAGELDEERKKKVGLTVSLLPSTQGSPTTSENGTKEKKMHGLETFAKSKLGSR